uniref:SGNH hydrolase-type esterase domain-containing protein n=1 Tax=Salix viminalis TaxID=40686 RepID=A0A6N2JVW0_SALVM
MAMWLNCVCFFILQSSRPVFHPSMNTNETDSHNGVNFAFSGATTLPAKVLVPKLNVDAGVIVNSLDTQLQWFDTYLNGFCQETKDCKEKLKSSLFIMGEIGANDYNMAFHIAGKTIEEKVIHYGFTRVLVPGIYRVGCAPGYEFNDFFNHHNDLLQADLEKLRKKYPGVSIVYGDYYNAMQYVMDNYKKFGFEYTTQGCYVDQGKPPCSDPQKHMFWDAYHSAENTNKYMASWIIEDIVSKFGCK